MTRRGDSVLDLIGNTPLVRLNRIVGEEVAELYAKMENLNPGGSVKDRIALAMIRDAEEKGLLSPGATIVEPTSGNTGIGLAMICAAKGYKLVLTMPDTMSIERRRLLASFGAQLVLTPGQEGMRGAVARAERIAAETPGAFMPQQFKNPANPEVHRRTTGPEIVEALGGVPDAFVAGVGTGGTITGVGRFLKERSPRVLVVAVEPERSPVLSGGEPGSHRIQGIGAGFVPEVLDTGVYDRVMRVRDEDAWEMRKTLARREGLMVGISAGANVFAAAGVARELGKGKRVVTILPDTGERYLSCGPAFGEE